MAVQTTAIQITTLSEEPGAKNLKVEVPLDRVKAAQHKAASRYAKRAKLPGFRPGKAPLSVVRKKYRDAIRETVIRELIGEGWKAATDQADLKPIAEPRVRDLKYEEGAPVTFELVVEVKPDISLARIGGFELTRKVTPVTDEIVQAQIDEIRRQKAPWVPIEGEHPNPGELVSIGIATLNESPEGQEGESKKYQIQLGRGQAIPDLEEKIMGLAPGESVEAPVRFPDDFPDETKRGQTRDVRITLHEIKRQELPELSDDLARELGDFDTAAALEAAVRRDLETDASHEADASMRQQLIDRLVAANNLEAPRPMVQRVLSAFAHAYEVPDDQLEKFAAEFGPIAERQVRRDLIVDHVAEREHLSASEEDVDHRIEEIAKHRNTEPGKIYASLQKANRLRELERNITEEKVFSYLLEQSKVIDE